MKKLIDFVQILVSLLLASLLLVVTVISIVFGYIKALQHYTIITLPVTAALVILCVCVGLGLVYGGKKDAGTSGPK